MTNDSMEKLDIEFREMLAENGYDINQLGFGDKTNQLESAKKGDKH
jgi:hypothetical protein